MIEALQHFYEAVNSVEVTTTSAVFKLCVSLLLGSCVGMERKRKGQIAGIRTFALISMGATLATSLLLFARIFDAVDDPIQGFVMDRGKRTKIGKYKPFFLLSILLTGIGCILLYSLPSAFATKPVLIVVWVIFFYLMFDVGTSFYKDNLLFRTMTNDPNERSKLVIGPGCGP